MPQKQLHKIEVAIFDANKGYLERLSKYLMSSDNYHFSSHSFSNEMYLTDFLNNHEVDILLISQEDITQEYNLNKGIIINLVGDQISNTLGESLFIYKFQSAAIIERQMINYYSINTTNELIKFNKEKGCQLIGIYSPAGGCGKTTLGVALGMSLATKDYKTLFLSLEEFPSYKILLNQNVQGSLSDLLYHIRKKTDNLMMKLEGIKGIHGGSKLEYLPSPTYEEDITETLNEDWVTLVESLKANSNYQYIIIDFTSDYSKRNQLLYAMCEHHILLTNETSLNISKVEAFINQKILKEENDENLLLIANATSSHKMQNINQISELKISFKVPFYENIKGSDNEGLNSLLIEGIGPIVEKIINGEG
jgi:MinD-like ATPase involved in chromosome partitioning or flagellar assembly